MFFKNIDSAMGVDSSSDDENFFDNQQSTKDSSQRLTSDGHEFQPTKNGPDSEFSNFDAELAGFGELQMPSVAPMLIWAGFAI